MGTAKCHSCRCLRVASLLVTVGGHMHEATTVWLAHCTHRRIPNVQLLALLWPNSIFLKVIENFVCKIKKKILFKVTYIGEIISPLYSFNRNVIWGRTFGSNMWFSKLMYVLNKTKNSFCEDRNFFLCYLCIIVGCSSVIF